MKCKKQETEDCRGYAGGPSIPDCYNDCGLFEEFQLSESKSNSEVE